MKYLAAFFTLFSSSAMACNIIVDVPRNVWLHFSNPCITSESVNDVFSDIGTAEQRGFTWAYFEYDPETGATIVPDNFTHGVGGWLIQVSSDTAIPVVLEGETQVTPELTQFPGVNNWGIVGNPRTFDLPWFAFNVLLGPGGINSAERVNVTDPRVRFYVWDGVEELYRQPNEMPNLPIATAGWIRLQPELVSSEYNVAAGLLPPSTPE